MLLFIMVWVLLGHMVFFNETLLFVPFYTVERQTRLASGSLELCSTIPISIVLGQWWIMILELVMIILEVVSHGTITAKSSWNTNAFLRFSGSFPFFVPATGVEAPSPRNTMLSR